MNNLPRHSQVHFLPLLLKRTAVTESSSSGVTINSDKQLSNEQTEKPILWGQCFWQVLEGESASGRSWKWYFNPRAMSSSTRNANTEALSLCIFIARRKRRASLTFLTVKTNVKNWLYTWRNKRMQREDGTFLHWTIPSCGWTVGGFWRPWCGFLPARISRAHLLHTCQIKNANPPAHHQNKQKEREARKASEVQRK